MLVFSSSGMKANLSCQPGLFIFTRAFFSISTVTWPARQWIWPSNILEGLCISFHSLITPTPPTKKTQPDLFSVLPPITLSFSLLDISLIRHHCLVCHSLGPWLNWLEAKKWEDCTIQRQRGVSTLLRLQVGQAVNEGGCCANWKKKGPISQNAHSLFPHDESQVASHLWTQWTAQWDRKLKQVLSLCSG